MLSIQASSAPPSYGTAGAGPSWKAHAVLAAVWVALLSIDIAVEAVFRTGRFRNGYPPLPSIGKAALYLLPTAWAVFCAWNTRTPTRGRALAVLGWVVAAGIGFERSFLEELWLDELGQAVGWWTWQWVQLVLGLCVLPAAALVTLWRARPARRGGRWSARDAALGLVAVPVLLFSVRAAPGTTADEYMTEKIEAAYPTVALVPILVYCALVLGWAIHARRAARDLPAPREVR
ncbi:MAG TPA: hypothetical protein VHG91_15240 [Longimicrobium sp.]|nr:hypothetical protein [Longimicrobium sp.]